VLQDAIIGLCSGPDALFTLGALREATTGFLTHLPQDSRAPPVEGLTWVSPCAYVKHSVQEIIDKICKVVFVHMHIWAVSGSDICPFKTGCHISTVLPKICMCQFLCSENRHHLGHLLQHHIQTNHSVHGSLLFLQIGGLLGGLIVKDTLNLQQAKTSVINAAAARATWARVRLATGSMS